MAILTLRRLKELIELGLQLELHLCPGIHDEEELKIALAAGAEIIGINNRDLRNFTVDMGLTQLSPLVPENCILIGESGIKDVEDAKGLRESGCTEFAGETSS